MSIENDYLGYQQDSVDALNTIGKAQPDERTRAIANPISCVGRSVLFGFSTRVAKIERLSHKGVERAHPLIERDIAEWSELASELSQRFDATWQDDEAYLLYESILELRMKTWANELALREFRRQASGGLQQAIEQFDRALHEQQGILSIVIGSTWWDNQRQLIASELLEEARWLIPDYS